MHKYRYIIFLNLLASQAFAQGIPGEDAGFVLRNISGSFSGIATLLFTICIVAGLSFGIAALFKFKQHKDNPAQVSVGQCFGLFFLAALMLWMPFLIKTLGYTVTGARSDSELQGFQNQLKKSGNDSGFGKFIIPSN